ncbi:MAG: hypothetical protein MAGBODY4_01283 [Candidatus Marinimicrobia bacterium]|nr:hypothetical protein [Candidatus Neomarinimicrobiota bacterium]
MRKIIIGILFVFSAGCILGQAPQQDQGKFVESKNAFWEHIKDTLDQAEPEEPELDFQMDVSGYDLPESPDKFTQYWHIPPVAQGRTGTCWSYSTTSFFESEVKRLHNMEVDLSEMYTVYWEYVEKARRFIRERGDSRFTQGSEANAVTRIWEMYGIVPQDAYPNTRPDQPFPDHKAMYNEMNNYLKSLEANDAWNEEAGLETIKSILNHYLGAPPTEVKVGRKSYTPKEYLTEVIKIDVDDYLDILSLKEKPFYERVEYPVPDNWWHNADYYNVPLEDFMAILKYATRNGYTMSIGGDVSEAGKVPEQDVFMVPTFDIPAEFINDDARQFRFSNETTTDDHGIHLIGYMEQDGKDWYLIKDSGSSARNGRFEGYYFFHEDYVRLKMMDFMVHKDAAEEILKKF